jgi:hypothetical protein
MEPKFTFFAKGETDKVIRIINDIGIENRRGDLPNLTKKETADLILTYADIALGLKDKENLVVELPDGRLLIYYHLWWEATADQRELREWDVEVITLKQKTPRSLRKWYTRRAWLYLAPYEEAGYKTDPTGTWRYRVWQ